MSNAEIIQSLYDSIIADIPEEIGPNNFQEVSRLLGKLPNDYAYLVSLLGYSRNLVRQMKRGGPDTKVEYEDMMDKSKALDDIASAVKLQYQAVSRMISLYEVQAEYNSMHESRKSKTPKQSLT